MPMKLLGPKNRVHYKYSLTSFLRGSREEAKIMQKPRKNEVRVKSRFQVVKWTRDMLEYGY